MHTERQAEAVDAVVGQILLVGADTGTAAEQPTQQ